jgi:ABC-type glycerol-3-phosphate transport system substrate-binding protein
MLTVKRGICIILALVFLVAGFAGCGKKDDQSSSQQTATNVARKYPKEIKVSATRVLKEALTVKDDLHAKKLKEKFNLVIERTDIPTNDYVTRMSLLLAAGEGPEFMYSLRPDYRLNEWTTAGYLKGFTQDEIKKLFPNYLRIWTAKEWRNVYSNIKSSDGKVYYFPGKRASSMSMAWVYRIDTLNSLGLAYPKTVAEMYQALKRIKGKTGRVPYVAAASPNALFAFSGFLQSFGMPELSVRELSYVDPVTKTFVPYAFSENNYRQCLKYLNKLYQEGLIWKEFSTATEDQKQKFKVQGNGYVEWGYPERIAEYDSISRQTDPTAKWDWSRDMVTADPSKIIFKRDPYFTADGIGFSSKISKSKQNRVFEYLNWSITEEGQRFNTFGVEGVTYEMKQGKPFYLEKMATPMKATGEKPGEYGLLYGQIGLMVTDPYLVKNYRPVIAEIEKVFTTQRPNYYFFTAPIFNYTEAENKKMTEIQTAITDCANEYAVRFIMGQSDPSRDEDWKRYIDTLNKLGLLQFKKIRTDAYRRANK